MGDGSAGLRLLESRQTDLIIFPGRKDSLMIYPRIALLATVVLLGASTSGNAAVIFTANPSNSEEVPPVVNLTTVTGAPRPTSFGMATFMLNEEMTALTFSATIFNIDVTGAQTPDANDNLAAAHIHAGPNAVPGMNASVV